MHRHDEVEAILNGLEQMLAVIDLNSKLALDTVVHKDARFDVHAVILVVPVRLECDRHAIPAVGVNVAQPITADLDDTLGHHVRLLVQMMVVLVGVVESAHGTGANDLIEANLPRDLLEQLLHHFSFNQLLIITIEEKRGFGVLGFWGFIICLFEYIF